MDAKRWICLLLAVSLVLSLGGCGQTGAEEEAQAVVDTSPLEFEEPQTVSEVHLRDNPLLYESQDPTEVVTMYLTVSTGNEAEGTDHTWAEINTYSVYDYERMGVERYKVAGLLQVGDENGPLPGELGYGQQAPNCTVNVRGQTSSRRVQKNYKISVKDNKGSWNGQTTIALNKHQSDGLRFRNKLAYDLIAGIDEMMGLRTTFVHLYVKDTTKGGNAKFQDYGLYTQVEQLNKTALQAHGLNKNGHLYKINFFEFYRYDDIIMLEDSPGFDKKKFEEMLETKGDNDHSKLIAMLDALNDYSIPVDDVLEQYFDVENLSYWLAFHILIGNYDTQSRNVYIYSPLNSEKWYFYSWDNDAALQTLENQLGGRVDGLGWERGVSNYWGNVLFQRALKSEKFRRSLDAAVEDLINYLSPERINFMVEQYVSVVKPYVYKMPDVLHAHLTPKEYDKVADNLAGEIRNNYVTYKASYDNPMPFYLGVPEVKDGKMTYRWDSAYDFEARNITYSFELARDYTFSKPLVQETDLIIPAITLDTLKPGQYFYRVTATNTDGKSQYAFDYYVTDGSSKVYGTKSFFIMKDGSVVEDIYVEG